MEKFDLLCKVDGRTVRLPFEEGKNLNPIAIYPSWREEGLCLEESEDRCRTGTNEWKIPLYSFWNGVVFPVKDELNAKLRELGVPPLDGCYFARAGGMNWIVRFREGQKTLDADYYDFDAVAKVRYCY